MRRTAVAGPPLAGPGAAGDDVHRIPFLFGTQYYRAPTPEPGLWKDDLAAIRDLGFEAVKYFVQWRWAHRSPRRFSFDDLDRLMDLAAEARLGVTLNLLLDVAPIWLFDRYPDAKPVDAGGRVVEPRAVGHRQIGGHPGPCYRHPGALAERRRFVEACIARFRGHPALQMWDVWNEPELCFPQRTPDLATMVCYCAHCGRAFRRWLEGRYGTLERLNGVWGRCYGTWSQVELPRDTGTFTDFVDWREFHLDTMTREAAWRLEAVRRGDPAHARYLHVVPNCSFSAVTCADDFALAEACELFAATMNGTPESMVHVVSAARGKPVYNVESHVDFGGADRHQRVLCLDDLRAELLPQVGAGVKGFLFWQYRSETLGAESPAWGLVRTDGTSRPVTEAARAFWAALRLHAALLRRASPPPAGIGVWRSRKNEIFHFCSQGTVDHHNAAIAAVLRTLYGESLPCRLVSDAMLAAGELEGLRLLVMPTPYYVTKPQADALDRWVKAGGVLLCDAHLAGYDGTTGRHARVLPGCGLAESWGIRELESTSSRHLPKTAADGLLFPIRFTDGEVAWGAHRYAILGGSGLEALGSREGDGPCIARVAVGAGQVFYCGTDVTRAAAAGAPAALERMLRLASGAAGIAATAVVRADLPGTVHLDLLEIEGRPAFAVVTSRADADQRVRIGGHGAWRGTWRGLFDGERWEIGAETEVPVRARFAELFVIEAAGPDRS